VRTFSKSWSTLALLGLVALWACGGPGTTTKPAEQAGGWESGGLAMTVDDVRFVDANRGLLASTEQGLWRTADQGKTWSKVDVAATPVGVGIAPDLQHLYVVGSGQAFQSDDLGQTFTRLSPPSDFHGWVVRYADSALVSSSTGDRVHRTTDGTTWTTHAFTRDELPGTRRMFAQGDDVWIVGGAQLGTSGEGAHLAHSVDRGQTWSVSHLTDNAHSLTGGPLTGAFIVSATEVWLTGVHRQLFHTVDRGATWTQVKGLPADVDALAGVAVVHGKVVVVARSTKNEVAVLESTDGATFTETATLAPPIDAEVHGVTLTPGGRVIAFGYAGLYFSKQY
jgi:photosystem II stability/assembly factor-like uncharacterized protein